MEKQEISRLFDLYRNDVFRLAFSYLRSRPDAEDICQSIFLKLLEQPITLLPGKEKQWLLTATANACKNHLRSFWYRNVGELDESVAFPDKADQTLYDAVMKLPSKYRAVIHLYYFEGYDQSEIGEILHLTRTAVQTRMSRAREMLKKELTDDEGAL